MSSLLSQIWSMLWCAWLFRGGGDQHTKTYFSWASKREMHRLRVADPSLSFQKCFNPC